MADWHGIRSAIATKLAAVSGVESASADDIDAAPDTPAVLVANVSSIELLGAPARGFGQEYREADINALLLVARTSDTGTAMQTAEDIAEAITVAMRTGIQLGYPTVVQDSYLRAVQMGEVTVGGITYIGGTLTFRVAVRENVTRTA